MNCSDLTNDILLESARPEVRDHLAACADCRSRASELRSLAGDLGALGCALPSSEDPALVRRIVSRLHRKPSLPITNASSASTWRWVALAAAAAVAVIGIVVVVATSEPAKTEPGLVSTPEKPKTERVSEPAPAPLPKPPPREPERVPAPKEPAPAPAPKPPEPPVPVPETRIPEPERPAPTPAEPAKPRVPPTETKPSRVFIAIVHVEGALDLGGKRVEKGAEWEKEATLHAGDRLSRLTLGNGTRLTLRPHAELKLQASETLGLERGEIFCEVIPGPGKKLAIVTPDATIQVTGTQFGVKRTDHTEVIVSAGEVKVSNDKGETTVPAGNGTTARKSSAPLRPRPVDAEAMVAWRRVIDPAETPRFRYDFEDGRKPMPWQSARVVPGPPRGLNKFCLEGSPGVSLDLTSVDKRVSTVKGLLKVRFRYYAAAGDSLTIMLWDERVKDNFRFDIKTLAHSKWEAVEEPLSEFYLLADGAAKIQEGDRLSYFTLHVWGAGGPVYFDDIELVEVLPAK